MNNNKKALKSGIWYTASNFLVRSIGFLTTPIFTRILTQEEFGAYSNYISWLGLITILVTLNLESTLISARYDFKEKFDEYILSVLVLGSLSVGCWFIFFNLFSDTISSFLGLSQVYINGMLIYLLFLPAINMYQARERYYFDYKKTVISSLVLALGTALLSVILVCNMENPLSGRIFGAILPTVLIGALCYCFFVKKGKKIKIEYWKYAIPVCLPYIPHLLAGTVLNSTDRVMINKWCGESETALYSLAYSCATIVTLLISSVNSAYAPWLGEKLAENKRTEIKRASKPYVGIFLYVSIGIMLISPEILMILGGESYMEAVYVMAPVSMGCICQFLYTLFVNVEQFNKKTGSMAIASVLAAILNLVLNFIFIPQYGYLAAAYTTLFGYVFLLIIHVYIVKKMGFGDVYSIKYIGLATFVGICSMVIVLLSYSNIIMRYSLLGIYFIAGIIVTINYKDKVKILLKRKNSLFDG